LAGVVAPVLLALAFEVFFVAFVLCFFVFDFVVLVLLAGALLSAGAVACAANVRGSVAAAKTIASKLFFVMFFSPSGSICPVNSILG
jgi:hypothetical protein